jgi:BED zinc finger
VLHHCGFSTVVSEVNGCNCSINKCRVFDACLMDQQSDTKSSLIRKHFNQLTNDDWSCCFCQRLLRQPGSSVSNLIKHLMKKHAEEYKIIFSDCRTPSRGFTVKTERIDNDDEEADDDQSNGNWNLHCLTVKF